MTSTTVRQPRPFERHATLLLAVVIVLVLAAAAAAVAIIRDSAPATRHTNTQGSTGTGAVHSSTATMVNGLHTGAKSEAHQYGTHRQAGDGTTTSQSVPARTGGNVSGSHYYGGRFEQ